MTSGPEPVGTLDVALAHAEKLLASEPQLAGEQAREILGVVPNHPAATLLLAMACRRSRDAAEAVRIIEPLAASQPRWAAAQRELGLALGDAGRGEEAVAATDVGHLASLRALTPATTRLFMLLGNTLGAFDAAQMARQLAHLLGPEDHLLVDGEIFSGETTLAGYDNPLNRQFAFGPLRGVGLVEPEDDVLRFETIEDNARPGLYRLHKHFVPARDLTLSVAGETIRWPAGQRVEMNWSGKYTHEAFLALLRDAGLAPVMEHVSADDRLVMALGRPRRPIAHQT